MSIAVNSSPITAQRHWQVLRADEVQAGDVIDTCRNGKTDPHRVTSIGTAPPKGIVKTNKLTLNLEGAPAFEAMPDQTVDVYR